jgi:hypothetical protein
MVLDFISKVWAYILNFFDALFNVFGWALDAIVYIALNIPFYLFEICLGVVYGFFSLLSVGSLAVDVTTGWGLLPPALAWLIGQIGIDTGLSMLGTAYTIRFCLNLIPAALTRV